ncbi:hypothetical protein BDW60DRAFT_137446 [Aspergillus nidulans var. acristatus]
MSGAVASQAKSCRPGKKNSSGPFPITVRLGDLPTPDYIRICQRAQAVVVGITLIYLNLTYHPLPLASV